jgi:hypothetical protein
MVGDQDSQGSEVRQDTRAGRDGYTAGRDLTVIHQHRGGAANTWHRDRQRDDRAAMGQPIKGIIDPYDLEVHPSIEIPDGSADRPILPPYIPRAHDRELHQIITAVRQRNAMAVLVGGSSTGKTRACWEAICKLPGEWRLWHPVSPTPAEALWTALQEQLIAPRTVLWLNETQFYLDPGPGDLGERIAAALRDLLRSPECGPVLILGTLWPGYWELLTRYPSPGDGDHHSQARALLAARRIVVPVRFEEADLSDLPADAESDPRIMEAFRRPDGRVTQFLAGGFELLNRYQMAPPGARALVTAAIDARRFKQDISESFLQAAAPGYVDDDTWDSLDNDWFEMGLEYVGKRCLGVPGPLTRIRPRTGETDSVPASYRLSDYLEQVGRAERECAVPPQSFWDAAAEQAATAWDIVDLAYEAQSRGRFRCAAELYVRAAREGNLDALIYLSDHRRRANDNIAAEQLLREAAERGLSDAWIYLAEIQEETGSLEATERLLEKAGLDVTALEKRARLRVMAGDVDAGLTLLEQAVEFGSIVAMTELAQLLEDVSGDSVRIKALRARATRSGETLQELREAASEVQRREEELVEREEKVVRIGSTNEETLREAREVLSPDRAGKSLRFTIMLGRIERNRGLAESARARFSQALDAGSMNEMGVNRPLMMLAEIMRDYDEIEAAERLMKYGLELDGSISRPWTVSMETQDDHA